MIAQRGWTFECVYGDRAIGAKERPPGLDGLMAAARRGLFDVVVVWRFDRFARSVNQLVLALEEFRGLGVDFVSHQEALDTSTPMGKAMPTIIAAMAELERSVIRDRVMVERHRQLAVRHRQAIERAAAHSKAWYRMEFQRLFDSSSGNRLRLRGNHRKRVWDSSPTYKGS